VALRKHNHEFGDALTYFSSMYNEKYNKNLDNHQPEQKDKIDGNLLRKTNMVLGSQIPQYITQSAEVYNRKPHVATIPVKRPEGNIDLGSD
jgi:recombination DNA repair RAD52 pathway protein